MMMFAYEDAGDGAAGVRVADGALRFGADSGGLLLVRQLVEPVPVAGQVRPFVVEQAVAVPAAAAPRLARYSALHAAAVEGMRVGAKTVLRDATPAAVNVADHHGNTALHWAASAGRLDSVEELLKHGAAVNAQNFDARTPLALAVLGGHVAVVERLLHAGANANLAALDLATPLHVATAAGSPVLAGLLLRWGAHPNADDAEGDTPLHYAVREGHADVAGVLLAHGADPTQPNEDGESPVQLAHSIGAAQIASVLAAVVQ